MFYRYTGKKEGRSRRAALRRPGKKEEAKFRVALSREACARYFPKNTGRTRVHIGNTEDTPENYNRVDAARKDSVRAPDYGRALLDRRLTRVVARIRARNRGRSCAGSFD